MLLKRFQIPESLADECEAAGEARPPRRVARIGDSPWCCHGSVPSKQRWSRGVNGRVCSP
jgi:hypothetical protein